MFLFSHPPSCIPNISESSKSGKPRKSGHLGQSGQIGHPVSLVRLGVGAHHELLMVVGNYTIFIFNIIFSFLKGIFGRISSQGGEFLMQCERII